jgi:hypothetical protein
VIGSTIYFFLNRKEVKNHRKELVQCPQNNSHLWLPESNISLTEKQNEIKEARDQELMLEQFTLSGEFPHMIQHFTKPDGEKT